MQKKKEKLVEALDRERSILSNEIDGMLANNQRVTLMFIIFPDYYLILLEFYYRPTVARARLENCKRN